jgi:hypothetical protein
MYRDALIDIVASRLKRSSSSDFKTLCVDELHNIQLQLENGPLRPRFLMSEDSTAACTIGDDRLALPTDYISIPKEGALWRYDSSLDDPWVKMIRDDLSDLRGAINLDESGAPTHYDLVGEYFYLMPVPDEAYTMKLNYYQKAADLSSYAYGSGGSLSNVWLDNVPMLLLNMLGEVMAQFHVRDEKAEDRFSKAAQAAYRRLELKVAEDDTAGMDDLRMEDI